MDERTHQRLVVDRVATCRGFRGNEQVLIYNLSQSGCMVTKKDGEFASGETLLINLIGGTSVSGEVVWANGSNCGLRFASEVPDRVVAYLGFKAPLSGTMQTAG
jgi:hypothetical protein